MTQTIQDVRNRCARARNIAPETEPVATMLLEYPDSVVEITADRNQSLEAVRLRIYRMLRPTLRARKEILMARKKGKNWEFWFSTRKDMRKVRK